ncbi:MAG: hypothetical protein Rsou_1560 [Candidatus Ruthia sp. Asou_11_S2]|nr:hypothetical protein [Candidatus Ruthia sp. Asou_11_S2]
MKNLKTLASSLVLILGSSLLSFSVFAVNDNTVKEENTTTKSVEECQASSWAIAIGHEQKWKLHNGCPTKQEPQQEKKNSSK